MIKNLFDWYLGEQEPENAKRAITDALARRGPAREPLRDAYMRALRALDGPDAVLAGYLADGGDEVRIGRQNESRHEYTGGTTGSGETRSKLNTLLRRLRESVRGAGIDAEILDPKGETFEEMKLCLAAEWLAADEATRETIAGLIYVIDWTPHKITPVDPLNTADDAISPAYAAGNSIHASPFKPRIRATRSPCVLCGGSRWGIVALARCRPGG